MPWKHFFLPGWRLESNLGLGDTGLVLSRGQRQPRRAATDHLHGIYFIMSLS